MEVLRDEEEDHLSSLPHAILVEIISRLPIKSAITTAILSTQWCDLWTNITSIDIDNTLRGNPILPPLASEESHSHMFVDFATVNRLILHQLKSPSIRTFSIRLPCYCDDDENLNAYFDAWLRHVCTRNVEKIHIESNERCDIFKTRDYESSPRVVQLPPCIFRTASLIALELDSYKSFSYELPQGFDSLGINLPWLKKLSIALQVDDKSACGNIANLIRACPSLEDLSLEGIIRVQCRRCEVFLTLDISSMSLMRLKLDNFYCTETKVKIDAPFLKHFTKRGIANFCFLTRPSYMVCADIWLARIPNRSLFEDISNVRSLVLDDMVTSSSWRFDVAVRFENLTNLRWSARPSQLFFEIPIFIQRCPALEVLALSLHIYDYDREPPHLWTTVPKSRMFNMIRRIEIDLDMTELNQQLLDFIQYLLDCGKLLEKLVVSIKHPYLRQRRDAGALSELRFRQKLYKCPRNSLSCQIEFNGYHLIFVGSISI